MSFVPLNPRPFLQSLIDQPVVIRLKWNATEYRGRLVSVDSYMNVQLSGCEEWIAGKATGTLGVVMIRCNNVLRIGRDLDAKGGDGDAEMRG